MGYDPNQPRASDQKLTHTEVVVLLRQTAFDIKVTQEAIIDAEKSIETLKMDTSDYQFKERLKNNLDFIAHCQKDLLRLNLKRNELLNQFKN